MPTKITSATESVESIQKALGEKGKDFEVKSFSATPVAEGGTKPPEAETVKAAASEPAETIEPTEPEEVDGEEVYDEDEKPEPKEAAEKPGGEKPKKKGGYQKRIDKLTKANADAQKERDYWREQVLRSQSQQKTEPAKTESKVETKPAIIEGKPKADDFKTHAEFVEALSDYRFEQREKAAAQKVREEKLKNDEQARVSAHVKRVNDFKVKAADFDAAIKSIDHIPMTIGVQQEILNSPVSGELVYELAKNPEEYERICKMTDFSKVAKAIGKIEDRIEARAKAAGDKTSTEPSTKTEIKTTKAPAPIAPVGGKSGATAKSTKEAKSYREFIAISEAGRN